MPGLGLVRRAAALARNTVVESLTTLVRFAPGPIGLRLRHTYYRRRLKYMGQGVTIAEGVYIDRPGDVSLHDLVWVDRNVVIIAGAQHADGRSRHYKRNAKFTATPGEAIIGRGCHVAPNSIIQAHGGVQIGDFCSLGAGIKIYSTSQHYRNPSDPTDETVYKYTPRAPEKEQMLIVGPVVLEDATALAVNSVVLPGVTIGQNSWVGPNSCVVSDIPANTIAMGNPAVPVKKRFART